MIHCSTMYRMRLREYMLARMIHEFGGRRRTPYTTREQADEAAPRPCQRRGADETPARLGTADATPAAETDGPAVRPYPRPTAEGDG